MSQQKPAKKSAKSRDASAAPKRHWIRNTILIALGLVVLGIVGFIGLVLATPVPAPNELATSQATIKMQASLFANRLAFKHLLDQVDSPARAIELIAKQLVGRTGCGTKPAMHALA